MNQHVDSKPTNDEADHDIPQPESSTPSKNMHLEASKANSEKPEN
jgi:hypothetical protein